MTLPRDLASDETEPLDDEVCPVCGMEFSTWDDVELHAEDEHPGML